MALQSFVGSFASPSGTGTQAITGVGFQPKAVVFWNSFITAFNVVGGTYASDSIGFDDGTDAGGQAFCQAAFLSGNNTNNVWSDDRSLLLVNNNAINFLMLAGYIQSMDADGFTINWDFYAGAVGFQWCFWAIGGSDVSGKVLFVNSRATPGTQATTGVGFQPKALMTNYRAGVRGGTLFGYDGAPNVGVAASSSLQAVSLGYMKAPLTTTISKRYQDTTNCLGYNDGVSAAVRAALTSFDADGFTLTYATSQPTTNYACCLALGGAGITGVDAGAFLEPGATGAQTVTTNIAASTIFIASMSAAASGSIGANCCPMWGAANATAQKVAWTGMLDATAVPLAGLRYMDSTHAIQLLDIVTRDITGTATVSAFNASSVTVTWTDVSAGARQLVYLALGTATPAAGSITVTKSTTPIPGGATVFPFTTTGGLSPSTFNLSDGGSQAFTGLGAGTYGVSESVPLGWSVSYSVSDGSPHEAIVLGAVEAVTVAVTNTFQSSTQQLRRLRRFALPYDENFQEFISRLEIVAAMGVGDATTPDPEIKIRFSRDGGNTWGAYRTMAIGAAGAYTKRAYTTRIGRGRNLVAELIMDDPVFAAWLQCNVQGSKGTS